jgi:hypothetical protein
MAAASFAAQYSFPDRENERNSVGETLVHLPGRALATTGRHD